MIYKLYTAENPYYKIKESEMCLKGQGYRAINDKIITSSNLMLEAIYECSGKRYASSKWMVTNNNNFPISINSEEDYENLAENLMHYYKKHNVGVYSISYDIGEDNVYLKPHKSVVLHLITNIEQKDR
jgi:hypothetical protein